MDLCHRYLSQALMQIDDMVFILDSERVFIEVWGQGLKRYGFQPEEFLGTQTPPVFDALTMKAHEEACFRVLEGFDAEYEWVTKGPGGWSILKTTLMPVLGEEGSVEGIVGVVKDTVSGVGTLLPPISFIAEAENGLALKYVSPGVESLGYSPKALYRGGGRLLLDLIHPQDLPAVLNAYQRAAHCQMGHLCLDLRLVGAGGENYWVRLSTWIQYEKGLPSLIEGIFQDTGPVKVDQSNHLMTQALDSLSASIAILDSAGTIVYTNAAWSRFGQANGLRGDPRCIGTNYFEVCDPKDPEAQMAVQGIQAVLSGTADSFSLEYPCHSPEQRRWFLMHVTPLRGTVSTQTQTVISHINITEKHLAEEEIQRLVEEQDMLLNHIDTQIWYLRDPQTYGAVNRARAAFLGRERTELEGRSLLDVMCPEEALACIRRNQEAFDSHKALYAEKWLTNAEGQRRLLAITKIPKINENGEVEFVVCTAQDITEKWESQDRLRYLSYRDKLTGLYNRAFFEQELRRLDQEGDLPLSVLMGDVNGLKLVNDGFGHPMGDELLVRVAGVIQAAVRKEDIVSRWGGDEFVILLPRSNSEDAKKIKERIASICSQESCGGIQPHIAIGYATKTQASQSIDEVLRQAEDKMYRNKMTESHGTRSALIQSLVQILAEKSWETEAHAQRIRALVLPLARQMELSDGKVDELALLASLHDIGKVAIPEAILNKPGPLTANEWQTLQKHPEIGYRIASSCPLLAPIAEAILHHHERWDGMGYPHGQKGKQIPITARILAVVDTFDAMTHPRPYRSPVSVERALWELERCAGSQFDPQVVELFVSWMRTNQGQGIAINA